MCWAAPVQGGGCQRSQLRGKVGIRTWGVEHCIRTPFQSPEYQLHLFLIDIFRQVGVVGKFVEFYGPGVEKLSIADRATIANMCPEYGKQKGSSWVTQ